ncbi:hypothetical protein GOODEAATRI_032514, partial [Goodea atripinnis]
MDRLRRSLARFRLDYMPHAKKEPSGKVIVNPSVPHNTDAPSFTNKSLPSRLAGVLSEHRKG